MEKKVKIKNLCSKGVEKIIDEKHLITALNSNKKLRIKYGIDPTGEKIHIGRAISLWKLKEFQDLGHKIVLIIGDFTALIGDPSDKLHKRPFLTKEQIEKNMKNYLPQIGKILDLKKVEVCYNSHWLEKLNFYEISRLAEIFSVSQILERRNFRIRFQNKEEISLRELLYPLMQGYDSVAVKSDVEIGGSDQLFNLLAGRKIQEFFKQKPQDIMTVKMLLGTNGEKMSTSVGNVINITDSPDDQYGKVMSIKDDIVFDYLELATDISMEELEQLKSDFQSKKIKIYDLKKLLAYKVVERYYGKKLALEAQNNFVKIFSQKNLPIKAKSLVIAKNISALELVIKSKIAKSNSEARRLIIQGGLKVGDQPKTDPNEILNLEKGTIVKIGKFHFFEIQ
jgi:tyrosyl-tRNA synthetase